MKLFKPKQNTLFVSEETYNWSPSRTSINFRIFLIIVLLGCAGYFITALS